MKKSLELELNGMFMRLRTEKERQIGALFKREAARNSLLLKPAEAILSVEKLVKWSQNHFTSIKV